MNFDSFEVKPSEVTTPSEFTFKQEALEVSIEESVIYRRRSWRERFFTRPWRPWISKELTEFGMMLAMQRAAGENMQNILANNAFANMKMDYRPYMEPMTIEDAAGMPSDKRAVLGIATKDVDTGMTLEQLLDEVAGEHCYATAEFTDGERAVMLELAKRWAILNWQGRAKATTKT